MTPDVALRAAKCAAEVSLSLRRARLLTQAHRVVGEAPPPVVMVYYESPTDSEPKGFVEIEVSGRCAGVPGVALCTHPPPWVWRLGDGHGPRVHRGMGGTLRSATSSRSARPRRSARVPSTRCGWIRRWVRPLLAMLRGSVDLAACHNAAMQGKNPAGQFKLVLGVDTAEELKDWMSELKALQTSK